MLIISIDSIKGKENAHNENTPNRLLSSPFISKIFRIKNKAIDSIQ